MEIHFKEAKKWLWLAQERSGERFIKHELAHMNTYLSKAGKSREDIGTSDKKIAKLLQ